MDENSDTKPIEEPEEDESVDEDPELYVVDPDDYQKTRKLKAINDAKDHVRKLRADRPTRARSSEWDGIKTKEAEAVAMYGAELMPLIKEGVEQGAISDDDLQINDRHLFEFVHAQGQPLDYENKETGTPTTIEYMAFYRLLNEIQRDLGLGLEFSEDKGPAQI